MQQARSRGTARAAALVVASVFGLARLAHADTKASIACRGAIAKSLSGVVNTGYKASDACHKTEDKASTGSADCNDVTKPAFDAKGKYGSSKTNASADVSGSCTPGDPVLDNYDGTDATGATFPDIDSTIGGNSLLVLGNQNLMGDKAKTKCLETIAKSRTKIVKEILKNSTKCQMDKDATAVTFGPLDPMCLDDGTKSSMKAMTKIPSKCTGLTGGDVGACSSLPGCAIDSTISAAQALAQEMYQKKTTATQVCGNNIVEGTEQCDDGNTMDGDGCNHLCESEANTCGPGTVAGGTIVGHRIVDVTITTPQPLAGVGIGFDYPQLETSIPGFGNSSVVRAAVVVHPMGGLAVYNDTDLDFSLSLANASDFITSGPFLTATLNECVPIAQNICNRNQTVVGCCPGADINACLNDFNTSDFVNYYNDCACGAPFSGVQLSDCTTNYKLKAQLGNCVTGACASPPSSIKCNPECATGAFSRINGHHSCTAGTATADCVVPPHCDDPGTLLCTDGDPAKIGLACTAATEATDCGPTPAGSCTSGNFCTSGDAGRIGLACSIANDCGTPITVATCQACPQLGDRTNGTFGCADIFNGPVCKPGHFATPNVGGCDGTASGPIGGCPLGNTCELQEEITTQSCTISDPVDHNGQHVDGVTCTITVTEAP